MALLVIVALIAWLASAFAEPLPVPKPPGFSTGESFGNIVKKVGAVGRREWSGDVAPAPKLQSSDHGGR